MNKKIAIAMSLAAAAGLLYSQVDIKFISASDHVEKEGYHEHAVDSFTLYRNLSYDAGFPDPEKVLSTLAPNVPPISAEGEEKMRQDSDVRLRALFPVAEILEAQANFGAAAFTDIHGAELDDHGKAEMFATYLLYGKSLLFGALAGLQTYMTEVHGE